MEQIAQKLVQTEPLLQCKLSEPQRIVIAELCPDLKKRMKLNEPNQRAVELTRIELDRALKLAEAAMPDAGYFKSQSIYKVMRILTHTACLADREAKSPQSAPPKKAAKFRTSHKSTVVKTLPLVYQFHIELEGIDPPIWRRIRVGDGTLYALHLAIQGAMGWDDSHMAEFELRGVSYLCRSIFDHGSENEPGVEDPVEVLLSQLLTLNRRLKFRYVYDFGDSWEHGVTFDQLMNATPGARYPQCIDGARACPPEDCGGIYSYCRILEEETGDEWIEDFDPEAFDAADATKTMRKMNRARM
jgi:hypothetical protein